MFLCLEQTIEDKHDYYLSCRRQGPWAEPLHGEHDLLHPGQHHAGHQEEVGVGQQHHAGGVLLVQQALQGIWAE